MTAKSLPKGQPGETPAQVRARLKAELDALEHPNPAKQDSRAHERVADPAEPELSPYRQSLVWNDERNRWEDDPAKYAS